MAAQAGQCTRCDNCQRGEARIPDTSDASWVSGIPGTLFTYSFMGGAY